MSTMLLHLALGAVMATGAPGTPVAYRASGDSAYHATARTVVEVDNRNFNDATVYAIQGLRSVRLGRVTGLTTQKLTIPADMVRSALPIRFAIRPMTATRSRLSDEIMVSQGDTVGLFIPPF